MANYLLRILTLASNSRQARGNMSRTGFRQHKSQEVVNTLAAEMAKLAGER